MNLTEWAHAHGVHVTTAYRWYREGVLPVSAWKAGRLILVSPGTAAGPSPQGGADLYARVSSHDHKAGLDRQVARRPAWVVQAGMPVVRVEAEVGSGVNRARARARARRGLAGLTAAVVVADGSEVTDDLVRDMIEALTSFCARLHGRRPARNRALKAVGCAQRDIGPQAVLTAGSTSCGGAG